MLFKNENVRFYFLTVYIFCSKYGLAKKPATRDVECSGVKKTIWNCGRIVLE